MYKCIYCLKNTKEFNKREHVMPRSFGKFKDNFVLNNRDINKLVCDKCNQLFGEKLEIELGRDSFEGLIRFKMKVREDVDFKGLKKNSSAQIKLANPIYSGLIMTLRFSSEKQKIVTEPLPQVGFMTKEKRYEFYSTDKLPKKHTILKKYNVKAKNGIITVGISESVTKEILRKYLSNDSVSELNTLDLADEVLIAYEFKISDIITRCISKIAFNYLAYFNSNKRDLLCSNKFDTIRDFILNGKKPSYPIFKVDNQKILQDEKKSQYYVLGHIITINTAEDKSSLIAQISFFNQLRYTIFLTDDLTGLRTDFGNFFNIKTKTIEKLFYGNAIIIPIKKLIIPEIIIP